MTTRGHVCPLCGRKTHINGVDAEHIQMPAIVAQLMSAHPEWRKADGACPACVQDALLYVLLSAGDDALHRQLQHHWPLDGAAAFAAIPAPLRLHADPRFTGKGVTVAVVDAGFYPHPDLVTPANRIRAWVDATATVPAVLRFDANSNPQWPGWDRRHDRQWHGMMTSVVLAGNGQLSHGLYRSVASDAEVVLLQVRTDDSSITDAAILRALIWIEENAAGFGIRVVNISLGSDIAPTPENLTANALDAAVQRLVDQGITVVAAAGNEGVRRLVPPATAPGALTIGGIDDHNTFDHREVSLWHSNYGASVGGASKPELVAPSIWLAAPLLPGSQLARTATALFAARRRTVSAGAEWSAVDAEMARHKLISPAYQHVDGTSFAAPLVASVIACMLEANPALSPGLVRQILLETAQQVAGAERARQGAGVLSAGVAVSTALAHQHLEFTALRAAPLIEGEDVTFWLHDHRSSLVDVYGAWDGWRQPVVLKARQTGVWQGRLARPAPGLYAYKFRLDNHTWLDDPANPQKQWDGYSGFNSLFAIV